MTTFNPQNDNNQIVSNTNQTVQAHMYIGNEYAEKVLNSNTCDIQDATIQKSVVIDMCYFSATMPNEVHNEIIRRNYLDYCEEGLKENNVLCLTGEYGVGVTTLLVQFAKTHTQNCVSYFNNGLDRICLNPEVVERSIIEQLYWFVFGKDENFDNHKAANATIASLYTYVMLKIKQTNTPLYFIFDGFDEIPSETFDGLKRLFSNILWDKARFLFSGKIDSITRLFPVRANIKFNQNEIMRFGEADVREYFQASMSKDEHVDFEKLYDITKGNGHRMDVVRSNYIEKGRLKELFNSDITGESELYDEDFYNLFTGKNNLVQDLFTLLAYAEFPLSIPLISQILDTEENNVTNLQKQHEEYILKNNHDILRLKSEGFHKYLRVKMTNLKQHIELRVIDVLENQNTPLAYCNYLPAIYKSTNKVDKLINYLNIGNIQQILVNRQSQAALNEQCNFGYEACLSHLDEYMSNIFRFALNKATSREIEKNELWDNEIEALLSVGQFEQAIALAQNIYLAEERLKSYLLITKKKCDLSDVDYSVLKDNIDQLVKTIDFENIPDKAVELAKLLLPVDYEAATDIIDRIAKKHKDVVNTDRLYALLSLAYNKDDAGNITNFDLVNSKIQDDSLRIFTHTAKNLFTDVDVESFLEELAKLPKNSQKLYFLQFWLPEHEKMPNVGKAVLEAIRLIVAESDTEIPKAKVLDKVCHSMQKMNDEEMQKAMVYIESMGASIKYPTFDYIDAELTIIEAIKENLPQKAKSRLEELYLYIIGLEDDSIRITCLSKLLGKFERLGKKTEIERNIISTVELRKEITDGVKSLLCDTAYHMKVIEGPIKALVCNYPTIIDELVIGVNTAERKSRAYSYAAYQYLSQEDEKKVNLTYFFKLLSKAKDNYTDRLKPLLLLSEMLIYSNDLNHTVLITEIKKNFNFVERVESVKSRCVICMRFYLWLRKNFPLDTFANKVKALLISSWEAIDVVWFKIEIGFFMAKHFAKISREEACEMITQCRSLKKNCFLASSSCVASYREALDLYCLSLCNLIRLDLCDNEIQQQFSEDIDNLLSKSELAEMWGKIALEYYLSDKAQMFSSLGDKYFPSDYAQYSLFDQKCIIYQISSALFIRNQAKFFTLLANYDENFKNDCIVQVCYFIITKQTLISSAPEHKGYELSYTDYTHLLVLLEQSSNDECFFNVIDIICKSLKITNQKNTVLSTEQKNTVIADAERIVNKNLPTKYGIRHDGYKIACQAALANTKKNFTSNDKQLWQNKINAINNKADQAFLYFLIAPYFSKRTDQLEFFKDGINISESIKSTFDKVNRLDMSISECIDHNLGTLIPDVAKSAMNSLANNGSLEEHKRLIDMAYQHKPELAEQLINTLDKDPARIRYKHKLQRHIVSVKKIEQAKKEMITIENLDKSEQVDFFETQLDNLVIGKGQLQEISKVFALTIKHIYSNSVVDAKAAIVYLMETIVKKQKQSKNQNELLFSIHQTIRYNLKLVLSLAAGTKECLDRIESMIYECKSECEGFINIGEYNKAETFLLNWYQKRGLSELTIIDPYFNPSDLHLIKQLCDTNTNLSIKILAHMGKNQPEDFSIYWHQVCSGVKCPIKINFVSYVDKPDSGPLHDRYWICSDNEHDKHFGIKLNSISGLGKKESSITDINEGMSTTILYSSYVQYVHIKLTKKDGKELDYKEVVLE